MHVPSVCKQNMHATGVYGLRLLYKIYILKMQFQKCVFRQNVDSSVQKRRKINDDLYNSPTYRKPKSTVDFVNWSTPITGPKNSGQSFGISKEKNIKNFRLNFGGLKFYILSSF